MHPIDQIILAMRCLMWGVAICAGVFALKLGLFFWRNFE